MQCVRQVVRSHNTSRKNELCVFHDAIQSLTMLISPAAVFASASQAASGSHPKVTQVDAAHVLPRVERALTLSCNQAE